MGIKISLGGWIKHRRIAIGITQAALAKAIGCATITLRKIEADERHPSRQMVLRIAACLSLTLAEQDLCLEYWRRYEPATNAELVAPLQPAAPAASDALPPPAPPLIGRDSEVAQIIALIRQSRVRWITIAGPPGIGKTRIGLQVARTLEGDFSAVCWMALAHLTDPAMLLPTIAQQLNLSLGVDSTALESLRQYLAARRLLLVLDNMEQIAAVAADIAMLLAAAPQLVVIVTSRIFMLMPGETIISIGPLPTPPYQPHTALDRWKDLPAVQLFVQRVQSVDPTFALTSATVEDVVKICCYLDGIPLALVLAAARTVLLPPAQLLLQIQQRMRVLADGDTGTHDHQTTLATLRLSIDFLPPQTQRMLWRMAIFPGGWTMESAAAVWDIPSDVDAVEAQMLTLIANSLVMRDSKPDYSVRFFMLETIREYALVQLQQSQEWLPVMERYIQYCLDFVDTAAEHRASHDQIAWCQRLTNEYPNIRTGLAWCVQHGRYELAGRLASGLWWFWWTITDFSEARHWYAILLGVQDQLSVPVRAAILFAAAKLSGNPSIALPLYIQSLALHRSLAQSSMVADCLIGLGQASAMQGLVPTAQEALTEALAIYTALGDEWGQYVALGNLGGATLFGHDLVGAEPHLQALYQLSLTINRPIARVMAEHSLGVLTLLQGKLDQARTIFTANAEQAIGLDLQRYVALSHHNLAVIALATNQLQRAFPHLRQSLRLFAEIGDTINLLACLECSSAYAVKLGQLSAAQHLLTTIATIRRRYKTPTYVVESVYVYPILDGVTLTEPAANPPMDVAEAVRFAETLLGAR